jgi:hypothetical protein
MQPVPASGEEGIFVDTKMVHWNFWVVRVLVPSLDRNQRQELKQRSKEFYLQRSDRKDQTDRHAAGPGIW